MSNEVFGKLFEQYEPVLAPVVKANKLAVANLEKLVNFQFEALRSYADLGLNQFKAAAEVSDVTSLQGFYASQVDAFNVLRKKVLDDAQALVDLSTGFKAEFDKLAKDSVVEFAPKSAARKAA